MNALFDRTYECPVCQWKFESKQVRTSSIRTKKREKDFHATFHGENPTYYGVICCGRCGFTQFESDFKKNLSEKEKERIKEIISSRWQPQDYSAPRTVEIAIKVHTIAIASYKVLGSKPSVMGKLYLRLAWFYRENGQAEESKKYIQLALASFIESYEQDKPPENEEEKELETIYLIGELNRQLGEYKEAIKWFDRVVRHEFAFKNRLIKTYAREQWALASEEHKEYKNQGEGQ